MTQAPSEFVKCSGVLFDCDGVLVDSRAQGEAAWIEWAGEFGVDAAHVVDGLHGRRSAETVSRHIPPSLRETALRRIEEIELRTAGTTVALPGAPQLVASVGGHAAVVTSATPALLHARLAAAGIDSPTVTITSDDVMTGKPSPEGYLSAAARLGLAPAQCVVIEDSPNGVAAGLAAHAGCVIGVGDSAVETGADFVAKDLAGVRWTGDGLVVPESALLRGRCDEREEVQPG